MRNLSGFSKVCKKITNDMFAFWVITIGAMLFIDIFNLLAFQPFDSLRQNKKLGFYFSWKHGTSVDFFFQITEFFDEFLSSFLKFLFFCDLFNLILAHFCMQMILLHIYL